MKTNLLPVLILMTTASIAGADEHRIDLSGRWQLALSSSNSEVPAKWEQTVTLPGDLRAQGIGEKPSVSTHWTGYIADRSWFDSPRYEPYRQPGNIKVPFWLTPDRVYSGPAWYRRDIDVPAGWERKRIVLDLERPHWLTRVWLDGKFAGENDSLGVRHEHDLGIVPTGKHTLTICVDNSMIVNVGENAHSVSDHTQGNWNGIVGTVQLRAEDPIGIDDLQVFPSVANHAARITGRLRGASEANVSLSVGSEHASAHATAGLFSIEIPLPKEAKPWDEFSPHLLMLRATVSGSDDVKEVRFGLREIRADGRQLTINGRPLFLRGTLECAIFPKTGHPPTDVASWKRVLSICRAHGLNHLRFHSWTPPEAAFIAADEMGFYYQVEISTWAAIGDDDKLDDWHYRETERVLQAYGNHPSFAFLSHGNEPGGQHSNEFLAKWVTHWKERDDRRLVTSGSGWPQLPENQYHVTPDPRIQGWGQALDSRINKLPPETVTDYRRYIDDRFVPVVSHEIGQWCVYPNFAERKKYTGYLKAKNFDIFEDFLKSSGLAEQAHDFLIASGKLQAICYKEEIESALRTPQMGGFELLDLHDFPGQGTALVGVLDPFWEDKGYITAAEYHRFCGPTVPLARLSKRVFESSEILTANLDISHFGPEPMKGIVPKWRIVDSVGKVVASGECDKQDVPIGSNHRLGSVSVPLRDLAAPAKYNLVVDVPGAENDWDVWVYPSKVPAPPDAVVVCSTLDETAHEALRQGKTVLVAGRAGLAPNKIQLGFSTIFWNTAWSGGQAPHTMGVLVDPHHPLFESFPTDFHTNWQWWYVVHEAQPMILTQPIRPLIQVIDDWFQGRRLALAFEANVERGRLIVCSIDLSGDLDPVRRQLRSSLLAYMAGPHFKPHARLEWPELAKLYANPAP